MICPNCKNEIIYKKHSFIKNYQKKYKDNIFGVEMEFCSNECMKKTSNKLYKRLASSAHPKTFLGDLN